jgi:hypothetical protein
MKLINKIIDLYKGTYLFPFWKWLYKQVSEPFEPMFKAHKYFNIFGKIFFIPFTIYLCMIYSIIPIGTGLIFTFIWLVFKLIIYPLVWLFCKIFMIKNFKLY